MFQKYASQILRKHEGLDLDAILVAATLHNSKEPAAVFGKPVQESSHPEFPGQILL